VGHFCSIHGIGSLRLREAGSILIAVAAKSIAKSNIALFIVDILLI